MKQHSTALVIFIIILITQFNCRGRDATPAHAALSHPPADTPAATVPDTTKPATSAAKRDSIYVKKVKMDVFDVDVYLTGSFAWSSMSVQKKVYKDDRPDIYIEERYPGILYYSKWMKAPQQKCISSVPDKIEFYNEKGILQRTFRFMDNNPYPKLYKDIATTWPADCSDPAEGDDDTYRPADYNPDDLKIAHRMSGGGMRIDPKTGITIITYSLDNYNKTFNWISLFRTLIVLDRQGKEIGRLPNQELYTTNNIISPDSKYLAFKTGGWEDIGEISEPNIAAKHRLEGVQVYDLETMKLIYKSSGFTYLEGPEIWGKDKFFYRTTGGYNDQIYEGYWHVIDPLNQTEYVKLMPIKEFDVIYDKALEDLRKVGDMSSIFITFDDNFLRDYHFQTSKFKPSSN